MNEIRGNSCKLHADRTAINDREMQEVISFLVCTPWGRCQLKALQYPPANLSCVSNVSEEKSVLLHARRTKCLRVATDGNDELVIRYFGCFILDYYRSCLSFFLDSRSRLRLESIGPLCPQLLHLVTPFSVTLASIFTNLLRKSAWRAQPG